MDHQEGVKDYQTVSTDTNQGATETSSHVNVAFSTDDIDSGEGRTAGFESEEPRCDSSNLSLDQSKKSVYEEEDLNVSEGDLGHIGPGILEFDEATSDIEKNGCDNASIQKKTHEQNGTVGFVMPKKNGHFPATNDTNTPDSDKEMLSKQKMSPEKDANIFSRLTFWWMSGMIVDGYRRSLTDSDIWELEDKHKAKNLLPKLDRRWQKEIEKMKRSPIIEEKVKVEKNESKKKGKSSAKNHSDPEPADTEEKEQIIKRHQYQPSLTAAAFKMFWPRFLLAALFKLSHDVLVFINPYLLGLVIKFVSKRGSEEVWHGYIYAVLMFVNSLGQSLLLHQYFHGVIVVGMNFRSALLTMIYRKMLRLHNVERKDLTTGEMVNMMSVDAQRCNDIMMYINGIWSTPLQIILAIAFLYQTMGWSIFIGFIVMVVSIPINGMLSARVRKKQSRQMKFKDKRTKIMNEILAGMKVIKVYAWEESFKEKVMNHRKSELQHIRSSNRAIAIFSFTMNCTPFVVSLVTFAVYIFAGNDLTAEKAFVAISLFNILRFPLIMLPYLLSSLMQYIVAIKRLSKFLISKELALDDVEWNTQKKKCAIKIDKASFTWEEVEKPILKNINATVSSGALVAIVGQVGSGKSSFLSSLLGDLQKVEGKVQLNGKVAYAQQQAWIQNLTLRDNILFSSEYSSEKYNRVIDACALSQDIDILPAGDMTEIGEKGINLSGGQKQRVSLARAVYANADVYFLDDPLSAVDTHVGKHLFDHVIGSSGLLKNKTRLLVTHNLMVLPQCDQIIVMKDGVISEIGTYEELVRNNDAFAEFLQTYLVEHQNEEIEEYLDIPLGDLSHEELILKVADLSHTESEIQHSLTTLTRPRAHSTISNLSNPLVNKNDDKDLCGKGKFSELVDDSKNIIKEETSQTGRVKTSVFFAYGRAITYLISFAVVFFQFGQNAVLVYSRIWLADWSSKRNITINERDIFLGVYGGLGIGQGVFILIGTYCLAHGAYLASKQLHNELLENILHCPMSFFETTPMGRIVNRFSKDINAIDEKIPQSLRGFLGTFMDVLATIFAICYSTPLFLVVLLPLGVLYGITQRFYVASSRQLKRLESVRRSPIYNHFFESINGASTIRAYRQDQRFIDDNDSKIDENQSAYFPSIAANRWLAMRLEFLGYCITFFAALFAIVQRDNLTPGLAGLSISYALQVTQTLNWMVRQTSELETNIIAVERVKEYIEVETEAPWVLEENRPDPSWPEAGIIDFEGYATKYRAGLDLVLKDIKCSISSAQKVGIVGRTGAGKSSVALGLFRIIEAIQGKITIDGVDISKIGLRDLRSKLTIIPQDPVLFSGTIRFNLDPFNNFNDADVWRALEIARLKSYISSLSGGLDHEIQEGGENLSVGQRQLICLGRALLRKTKVLILDEATAAVDMETDDFIQKTIRTEFKDCTILTIAHRLNTIIDYDRIIVLDQGNIIEFGSPQELLEDKDGSFYSMAKEAGITS